MRDGLRSLGLTDPWKIWLAVKNFAKTVSDPTRSDIRRGIDTLVYRRSPPRRRVASRRRRAEPALAALFAEGYDGAGAQPSRAAAQRHARPRVSRFIPRTGSTRPATCSRSRGPRTCSNISSGPRKSCTTCSTSSGLGRHGARRGAHRGLLARPVAFDGVRAPALAFLFSVAHVVAQAQAVPAGVPLAAGGCARRADAGLRHAPARKSDEPPGVGGSRARAGADLNRCISAIRMPPRPIEAADRISTS